MHCLDVFSGVAHYKAVLVLLCPPRGWQRPAGCSVSYARMAESERGNVGSEFVFVCSSTSTIARDRLLFVLVPCIAVVRLVVEFA